MATAHEVTIVEVRNPVNHIETGKKYTDFEICIKTTNIAFIIPQSYVRRRYSDFVWLRSWLAKNNGDFMNKEMPKLPPKKLVNRFDHEFLKDRMSGLQTFLRSVILHNVFLSDKALHLFLQSGIPVNQINDYLLGKVNLGYFEILFDHKDDKISDALGVIQNTDSRVEYDSVGNTSPSSFNTSSTESFEKVDAADCRCNKEDKNVKENKSTTDIENAMSNNDAVVLADDVD